MAAPETSVENLKPIVPDEVEARNGLDAPGNKEEFLRAARGLVTEEKAARFEALINEICERCTGRSLGSPRKRVNRLPLLWTELYFPRRHVFLQVRER
jgi:hypothetical protein